MTQLVLGANTVIEQPQCTVSFSVIDDHSHAQHADNSKVLQFGRELGLLWLPLNKQRKAASSPAYLHEPKKWATLDDDKDPTCWQLNLNSVFVGDVTNAQVDSDVHFLQLIVYTYNSDEINLPAIEIQSIDLKINDGIHYQFKSHERHVKAAIVLEIYKRNGVFKCRALGEASTHGLSSLGKHVEISLDSRPPDTHAALQAAQDANAGFMPNDHDRPPRQVTAGETWTGTAFAIDSYHLLTCYHVIESASVLGVRQQGEEDREVNVVMSDVGSDMAIIKVKVPLPSYLPLATQCGDLLGETITTLGFPLSGLNSQLQVTQGCISGLTGFSDDIRYMQFTAPIQPGSSGSPLILPTGEVVGMVTASLSQAQNMNYAVKFQLLSALLTSAGIDLTAIDDDYPSSTIELSARTRLTTPELSRKSRGALWLVGAQA